MHELTDQNPSPTFRPSSGHGSASGNRAAWQQRARHLNHQELERRLVRIRRLSRAMDSAIQIPGTRVRFGLDSLIGLVPGLGDLATAGVSAWVVHQAYRSGVSNRHLARMLGNIAIDFVGGSVPLAGDLFDVYWKANQRNVELLEAQLRPSAQTAGAGHRR